VSLGIAIKGPEGIVLAADSRVTLFNQLPNPQSPGQTLIIPATFDNATKLLKVTDQNSVGAVTYGLGAMMTPDGPRTMQSFIPEFEEELKKSGVDKLLVQDFAERLSQFFLGRWDQLVNRPANPGDEISFLVGGYDEGLPYGRTFLFQIPTRPIPTEQNAGPGQFGITWGGQHDLVYRLLYGFDIALPNLLQSHLKLTNEQLENLSEQMRIQFAAGIPFQFLPLQDCVDLAVFLIRSTINFQRFRTSIRGVGGPIEVATVTRAKGFKFVAQKQIISDSI
jgi:hypothetical protein